MDKRKYESKTLIAEYKYLSELEEFRFSEKAYRLKDGSIIIEFDGASLSLYGLKLSFKESIGRKGLYSIDDKDYKFWKLLRSDIDNSYFVDWEQERNDQYEETWQEQYNNMISMQHQNILEKISGDELPF
ncbi:hypothetical protein [Clostridium saccharobutylicum]|uniref:hypothetical protein n=1 Tax=Clostridium saccharobutylicum TaxID=169679 RepID=UPI0003FFE38F|nr:hypothetical protein [Clostridium saccharobutylicum]AQR88745.1 hypothetical protein CLOSC_04220 [Clostridium saccharobutylicum]AQR98643.1 hypothetical protein CSACC_04280 [Clostridium saccharobutylicum]AQS12633.1 hypothetical protein CLOSACC_04280 [Clostridium saccharobutylicum]MBA2905653.1 hypothetical protein [Clostridium saccharobutylicum]MBA8790220.1 hypothetical protein [Clostridium saccharobutylicum]